MAQLRISGKESSLSARVHRSSAVAYLGSILLRSLISSPQKQSHILCIGQTIDAGMRHCMPVLFGSLWPTRTKAVSLNSSQMSLGYSLCQGRPSLRFGGRPLGRNIEISGNRVVALNDADALGTFFKSVEKVIGANDAPAPLHCPPKFWSPIFKTTSDVLQLRVPALASLLVPRMRSHLERGWKPHCLSATQRLSLVIAPCFRLRQRIRRLALAFLPLHSQRALLLI